jgi:hypothetical protein
MSMSMSISIFVSISLSKSYHVDIDILFTYWKLILKNLWSFFWTCWSIRGSEYNSRTKYFLKIICQSSSTLRRHLSAERIIHLGGPVLQNVDDSYVLNSHLTSTEYHPIGYFPEACNHLSAIEIFQIPDKALNKHLLNGLSADYSLCVTFRLVNYHLSVMVACLFVVGCGCPGGRCCFALCRPIFHPYLLSLNPLHLFVSQS